MMSGIVKNGYPTVNVIFRLPNQPDFTIEFVIDTGFKGDLSLPTQAVTLLGLPFLLDVNVNLADNSNSVLALHQAVILWNGEEREVTVLASGRRPLLGRDLLTNCELVIQFTEGGLVRIEEYR